MTGDTATAVLEDVFHEEWPRLVGFVANLVRDLDVAEEIVQESLLIAMRRWPFAGVPQNPGAWLTTTCRNRALNHIRDSGRRRHREVSGIDQLSVSDIMGAPAGPMADDRLRLIFLCCHPEIPRRSQVALTLRLVAGLATADIARAFLVSEATMAQRITRAKRLVSDRQLSFEVPEPHELRQRLTPVLDVIYLIFNEAYLPRAGESLQDAGLAQEAHRLAALLTEVLPADPEAWALRALIAFQRSRTAARSNGADELVPLPEQDRALWDRGLIRQGDIALAHAAAFGCRSALLLQAEIASVHASAASWSDTDWPAILALYDELAALAPSPVVSLNRAVAVAMTVGPTLGIAALDEIATAPELQSHHLFWAVRGDQLCRLGDHDAAIGAYGTALTLAANAVEQRHLTKRIEACRASLGVHHDHRGEPDGTC